MEEKTVYNKQVTHTREEKKDPYGTLSTPVYNTVSYEFESAEAMELAFTGKSDEYVYSRISNPTVQSFENKVRELTGAYSVTALNSGMAAISNTLICLAYTGCNIVSSRHLFGNTYALFNSTLAAFGIETRFCDLTDIREADKHIDSNTCAVFLEIISNPQLEVIDLEQIAELAQKKRIPLIADTTLIPFCSFNANKHGIDIEVVSSTKYISGGATGIGGLILDYGRFDWSRSDKLKQLATEQGKSAFTFKLRNEIHRNLGAYMTPQAAYMQSLGLETLQLRYQKASATASELAHKLSELPAIRSVNYPGLKNSPFYKLSQTLFGRNPGAMLTFDLESAAACFRFLNRLKLIKRATNLFDNKTLAIHPYTTIYGNYSPETKALMHIYDTTIRLSVGLEAGSDLLEDICGALNY